MLPPFYNRSSLNRRDTAFQIPEGDLDQLVEMYDTMNQRVLGMKKYGYEKDEKRKNDFIKEANFDYDPNLSNANLQKTLIKDVGEYQKWYTKLLKEKNYNLSTEDRLKATQAKNILSNKQAELMGSQKLLTAAYKQYYNDPTLWDGEYLKQAEQQLYKGEPVYSFLQARRGNAEATIDEMIRDKGSKFKVLYKTKEGNEDVTREGMDFSTLSKAERQSYLLNEFENDLPAKRDFIESFNELPEKEKKRFGNVKNWIAHPDGKWMKKWDEIGVREKDRRPHKVTASEKDKREVIAFNPNAGGDGGWMLNEKPARLTGFEITVEDGDKTKTVTPKTSYVTKIWKKGNKKYANIMYTESTSNDIIAQLTALAVSGDAEAALKNDATARDNGVRIETIEYDKVKGFLKDYNLEGIEGTETTEPTYNNKAAKDAFKNIQ